MRAEGPGDDGAVEGYEAHECSGDKCTHPNCRFAVHLSFVVHKAAVKVVGTPLCDCVLARDL